MNIIINDPGGYIWQHVALGQLYAQQGAHLVVAYCTSACFDLLAQVPFDHIYIRPSAWMGRHSAVFDGLHPESTTTMIWERGSDWIARGWAKCE